MIKNIFRLDLLPRLRALNDVEETSSSVLGRSWRSTGNDPQFLVRNGSFGAGWYMLELQLEHERNEGDACVYVHTNKGFNEGEKFSLPLKVGKVSKRLLFFPTRIQAMRFDPFESSGQFTIKHFQLVRLSSFFARDRLAQRLSSMHVLYRGLPKTNVFMEVKKQAREIGQNWKDYAWERYSETFERRRQGRDYQDWIFGVERLDKINDSVVVDSGPLFSILLPTYNSNIQLLIECIESVLNQSYQNWELCIADDASSDPGVVRLLKKYVSRDSRIRLNVRLHNGHISAASNSALAIASGDYIVLLDHDDLLAPHALSEVSKHIAQSPNVRLLYSDEDKVDVNGRRFDPHFKPTWNPDLLLSQNYICHLMVLQTDLVRGVGGFREGAEGSQDHDLLLRCMSQLCSESVIHIPKILYHWRAVSGSTALASDNKDYAIHAGLRAIEEYLAGNDLPAKVELGTAPNTYAVHWLLPKPTPLVSLLIPTRDGYEILKPCVDALLSRTDYPNFEVLILDNQSSCSNTLRYLEEVSSDSRLSVYQWDFPFNYSAINNFGAKKARGDILGLINNDIEPINDSWLREMVGQVCRPEIGCVGAKLYYPNDTVQHGGVILGIGGVAGHSHKYFHRQDYGYFSRLHLIQNMSAVTGACLLVRKSVFNEVGGLDEDNLAITFNDVDLCLKVREAGYRNLWTPYAELYHHESVSRGADDTAAKRRRAQREADYMRRHWGEKLDSDPAYNPNLTLIYEDFSLA